MNISFWYALIAILIISIGSIALSSLFIIAKKKFNTVLYPLVAIAAGVMISDSFLHLIPESFENIRSKIFNLEPGTIIGSLILIGIIFFFILEKLIHWRHCHVSSDDNKHIHPFAYSSLFADGFHNFIDGLLIGAAFMVNIEVGITTAVAVGLHEIPQEFSDIGILIHAGFSSKKAMIVNFLTALTAIAGLITVTFLTKGNLTLVNSFLPFTAGGFIYIAISDLIPELKHHENIKKSLLQLFYLLLGISFGYILLFVG